MKPVKVESSNITALGYTGGDLYVRFKATGVYRYRNVPPQVVLAVVFAESPGGALNTLVKKEGYAYEQVPSPFADDKVAA